MLNDMKVIDRMTQKFRSSCIFLKFFLVFVLLHVCMCYVLFLFLSQRLTLNQPSPLPPQQNNPQPSHQLTIHEHFHPIPFTHVPS